VLWFPEAVSKHVPKFQKQWLKKTNVQGEGKSENVTVDEDGFQQIQMG
jgi:hypothetical protein